MISSVVLEISKTDMQATLLFCKELGLSPVCIKGEGTSNYSQRIFEKFDFETIQSEICTCNQLHQFGQIYKLLSNATVNIIEIVRNCVR
jgi:hypothetical protein